MTRDVRGRVSALSRRAFLVSPSVGGTLDGGERNACGAFALSPYTLFA